eukprot:3662599-Pyramimonas_sp.AAC.1
MKHASNCAGTGMLPLQVLVKLSTCEHVDVLSQVARGFANNSKCTKGKTHLVELGALPAILHLASKKSLNTVSVRKGDNVETGDCVSRAVDKQDLALCGGVVVSAEKNGCKGHVHIRGHLQGDLPTSSVCTCAKMSVIGAEAPGRLHLTILPTTSSPFFATIQSTQRRA